MHDNKNKYTFRKHKAYGLVGAMFATALIANPNVSSLIPFGNQLLGSSTVHADSVRKYVTFDYQPIDANGRPLLFGSIGSSHDESYDVQSYNTPPIPEGTRYLGHTVVRSTSEGETWLVRVQSNKPNFVANENLDYGNDILRGYYKEVGTKPKVVTEEIQSTEKRYIADKTREKGAENIEVAGTPGRKETTTTYTMDVETGAVTPNEPTTRVLKDPTPTVVKVAAKNKVETIQRGRQTVENETQNKQNSTSNRLFILSII